MGKRVELQHVIFAVIFLLFVMVNGQPVSDTDFWWHLKAGEYIWQTKTVPHADVFLIPCPTNPGQLMSGWRRLFTTSRTAWVTFGDYLY